MAHRNDRTGRAVARPPSRPLPWLVGFALATTVACSKKETSKQAAETSAPPADYGKCDSFIPGEPVDLSNEQLVVEMVEKDGRGGAVAALEQLIKRCAKARVAGPTPGSTTEVVILDVEVKAGDGKVLLPFRFRDYSYIPSATQTVTFSAPAAKVGADKALEVTVRASRM